ncbi:hypothetical protein [Streptomyces lavendofoliae]|uniref:Uncharacterized protein n=1 Tax=Streptomyces lavendofoliae TaxID=67314 RepID=A0A918I5C8_9ACTN|nr:hypothetical protein [Streptomyces lavendofoliae]GGU66288.1 hypothetical protein GCM10010274_63640 [Streptomyces lavendofoliae]
MTSPIDELLARARLVDRPYVPLDITRTSRPSIPPQATAAAAGVMQGEADRRAAADDLTALCQTVVSDDAAVTALGDFLTEPFGARVLGCILQLTDAEDSARFWWQYAAGAGDTAASYCLYLHHLALGEQNQATWWQQQATPAPPAPTPDEDPPARFVDPARNIAADASLPTTLRVLKALKIHADQAKNETHAVEAVIDYVSAAVSYVDDDVELPLPDPDFTDHIRALTHTPQRPPGSRTTSPLPARSPRKTSAIAAARRRTLRHPDQLHPAPRTNL